MRTNRLSELPVNFSFTLINIRHGVTPLMHAKLYGMFYCIYSMFFNTLLKGKSKSGGAFNFKYRAMTTIKVLIADDHEILRYGISTYLKSADKIDIVGEASTGTDCITLFKKTQPDVCVIDIDMPDQDGIETAKALRELDPDAKILIFSMFLDQEILKKVLRAGINGYLLKTTDKADLLHAIESVAKGQQVFSDKISKMMTDSFIQKSAQTPAEGLEITSRELEILQLIADGLTSQEIADRLYISPRTVDTHRSNIMKKLDINNAAGLVRYAVENDLIPST